MTLANGCAEAFFLQEFGLTTMVDFEPLTVRCRSAKSRPEWRAPATLASSSNCSFGGSTGATPEAIVQSYDTLNLALKTEGGSTCADEIY
jgi:hypothetical protein